jgi:hypothetical protein
MHFVVMTRSSISGIVASPFREVDATAREPLARHAFYHKLAIATRLFAASFSEEMMLWI